MTILPFYTGPKRYLVTGGCGFIGSHLVDALIEDGHSVLILDDLSTGKKENVNPKATLLVGDTRDYKTVQRAFRDIDGCFHLAAIASVEKANAEWAESHMTNVLATINVFKAAVHSHIKIPVVYTSSAAVYGDCAQLPISETANATPLTAYGADKYACDLQGLVAWKVHGVPNMGLRPFNVYGPRQDPMSPYSGVISIFVDRIQQGKEIKIFGDGKQVRDFVYVADAVRAFIAAMKDLHDNQAHPGHDVINICTGVATSINDLAYSVGTVTGYEIKQQTAPPRLGDIRVSVGDPRKLEERLGIRMMTTLEEGLQNILDYSYEELPLLKLA